MNPVGNSDGLVVVTHRAEATVAMRSPEDAKALDETSYLLQSPRNTQRLIRSIASLSSAQGTEVEHHP